VFQAYVDPTVASLPVNNCQLIGMIMAYRWRTNTADERIPSYYRTVGADLVDFSVSANFPGYGIRSLAELQVPFSAYMPLYVAKLNAKDGGSRTVDSVFPTIADRDAIWGAMCNALTVRSDTFVVYAYLEAVRQNPRYVVDSAHREFVNDVDWYTQNLGEGIGITDDPNDTKHALLRVGRRRWVAIVDRSQANYSRYLPMLTELSPGPALYVLDPRFTLPRIVAQKDLPR
jgi:hypothetical protein